jgi:nicotinamide riboside kinase
MREDGIRLRPDIDEMNEFTSVMEDLLQEMCIPYILIDVLDLKERVKIVRDEINKRQII